MDEVHSAPVPTGLCGGLVGVLLPHEAVGWPRVGLRGAVRGRWKAASGGVRAASFLLRVSGGKCALHRKHAIPLHL